MLKLFISGILQEKGRKVILSDEQLLILNVLVNGNFLSFLNGGGDLEHLFPWLLSQWKLKYFIFFLYFFVFHIKADRATQSSFVNLLYLYCNLMFLLESYFSFSWFFVNVFSKEVFKLKSIEMKYCLFYSKASMLLQTRSF